MTDTERRPHRSILVAAATTGLLVISFLPSASGESPDPAFGDMPNMVEDLAPVDLRGEAALSGQLPAFDLDGSATVEVVVDGNQDAVRESLTREGVDVVGEAPGILLVRVDSGQLAALRETPGVTEVRTPLRVDLIPEHTGPPGSTLSVGGEHITLTNADTWHAEGHSGAGVKVGIIDYFDDAAWGSAMASGDLPAPVATFCRDFLIPCDLWISGTSHGVAVAEVVHDMAPSASLYLATAVTMPDLVAAVAWFDQQGVQIITRSLAAQLDGPGDGTGPLADIADDAVSRGMLFLNSAGNHASSSGTANGGYWRGSFTDSDSDGWMEFAPGDETLAFSCGYIQGFRWSDWQVGGRSDYDIVIYNAAGSTALAWSVRDQTAGADPIELIDPTSINCNLNPTVLLVVRLINAGSGTSGDVLEFMVNGSGFETSSNPYSASQPIADSLNPAVLSIGAIDPAGGTTIAYYSSRGPTNDGRIKPDISAPSCLTTNSYAPSCFNGTSAATPVVAGAAALVLGSGEATTPTEIAAYLRASTVDRGPAGADNTYGIGQLVLGAPPLLPNQPPVVSAGPDTTVVLPTDLVLSGSVTDDGKPSGTLATIWSKLTGPGVVSFDDASIPNATASFSQPGDYTLQLLSSDGALSSTDTMTVAASLMDYFTDDDGTVHEGDNNWLAFAAVTKGCNPPTNDRYCPDSYVTRGQMAAFLSRAFGLTARLANPFTDDDGSLFESDIERIAAAGITKGCNPPINDRFCPDANVTREQMAAFLVRAFGYADDGGGDLFTDDDGSIFEGDIDRLGTAGITKGCNPPANDNYCPSSYVTRGQMAAFLHRALG